MRDRFSAPQVMSCCAIALVGAGLPGAIRVAADWLQWTLGVVVRGDLLALLAQLTLVASAATLAAAVHASQSASRLAHAARPARAPWRTWSANAGRAALAIALVGTVQAVVRGDALTAMLASAPVVLGGPVAEELVYRAFMPALLLGTLGGADDRAVRGMVAVTCAVTFAAAHPGASAADGAMSVALGLSFHALRSRTGGIETPILVHAGVNAVILDATNG